MISSRSRIGIAPFTRAVVTIAVLLSPQATSAQDWTLRIDAETERIASRVIDLRHRIHKHPELGFQEVETARLVANHLRELGIEVETGIAETGVIGVLRGGRPGPVVAVRADMDALPVTEQTDLPFRSTRRTTYLGQEVGVAHACGHDIHTSVQLGVASVLSAFAEDLPGTIKFIFQPAEEGPPPGEAGGAIRMIEEGALTDPIPSAIFALHTFPDYPVGTVGHAEGPTLASSDHFIVTIRGRQAHGAAPHLSVDPIVTAAQVILALQTIRSRNLSPLEPGVVTVGIIHGGERSNIIPDEVRIEGTIRTYDPSVRREIQTRIREIVTGVTEAAGASFEMDVHPYAPPVINDPKLAALARVTLERVLGPDHVIDAQPIMGAEDFAHFAGIVPGFYLRLGVVAPGTSSGGLHTPDFRADDSAIPVGVRAMSNLVLDFLLEESD